MCIPLALITGASTGIGRATALRLAASGWTVLAGVRDPRAGERLVRDASAAGEVVPLALDITDAAQIADAAATVRERVGTGERRTSAAGPSPGTGLDALVNNAGVGMSGPLELVSAADLRAHFEVNFFGQVAVTQAMLPLLRSAHTHKGTGGRIVFVSSIGGRVAMAFTAPYAASKHALEALGDTLRVELRTSGIQVALVEPASVATPIWDKSSSENQSITIPAELAAQYGQVPAAIDKVIRKTAARGVPPEQVAETIERALSARRMRARYVIGTEAKAMLAAKRLLPDHVFDMLARRALGV